MNMGWLLHLLDYARAVWLADLRSPDVCEKRNPVDGCAGRSERYDDIARAEQV